MTGTFSALAQGRDEAFNETVHAALDRIPSRAAVYSATRFGAYLSNRTNLLLGDLNEPDLDLEAKLTAETAYTDIPPAQVDYIVSDILNAQNGPRMTRHFDQSAADIRAANIKHLLATGQWQVFWNENNVVILRRAGN